MMRIILLFVIWVQLQEVLSYWSIIDGDSFNSKHSVPTRISKIMIFFGNIYLHILKSWSRDWNSLNNILFSNLK